MPIEVLFIHSAGAQDGDEGSAPFVRYLSHELGSNYRVTSPTMPLPDAPTYKNWERELAKRLSAHPPPKILVGHSLGGSVLLKYLSEHNQAIQAASLFVVAAPYWGSQDWEVEEFVLREGFPRYLPSELNICFYQSQNDEVVPIEHLSHYAKAIPNAKVRSVQHGGHTFKDGLQALVDDIRALST